MRTVGRKIPLALYREAIEHQELPIGGQRRDAACEVRPPCMKQHDVVLKHKSRMRVVSALSNGAPDLNMGERIGAQRRWHMLRVPWRYFRLLRAKLELASKLSVAWSDRTHATER